MNVSSFVLAALLAVLLAAGCTGLPNTTSAPPTSSPAATVPSSPAPTAGPDASATPAADVTTGAASGDAFTVTGDEARAIATVVRFVDAINGGDLRAASDLMTTDASVSDCDYATGAVIIRDGNDAASRWIADRIADHERLEILGIYNHNASFDRVVGVSFVRRSNDMLKRLGAPTGIVPSTDAKVVLTADMTRIATFALGPGGAGSGEISRSCSATG